MRILITGGGGFIGAWTARRFIEQGHLVTSLDLSEPGDTAREILGTRFNSVDWRTGDVVRYDDVLAAAKTSDGIIHLAGLLTPACQRAPVLGAKVNVIGALNAFEVAKKVKIDRVIYASSISVFGPDNSNIPHPTTHYGAFKLAVEGCGRAYYEDSQICSIGFRPAVVYGFGRTTGLTAGLTEACRAAAMSGPFNIGFSGDVPVVYVEDVARALVDMSVAPVRGAQICNLVGNIVTVSGFIEEIRNVVSSAEITCSGPTVPFSISASIDPVTRCLPDFAYTPLGHSVEMTIEGFRT